MRSARIVCSLLFAAVLTPATASAQATHDHDHEIRVSMDVEDHARVVSRMDLRDADFVVVTQRRNAALIIEGDEIVLQLTDRGLADIDDEIIHEGEHKGVTERVLSKAIFAALKGSITALLDHGVAYPIAQIERVWYENGTLRFRSVDGEDLFDDVDIGGRDIMSDFSVREARSFIAAFKAAKRRNG